MNAILNPIGTILKKVYYIKNRVAELQAEKHQQPLDFCHGPITPVTPEQLTLDYIKKEEVKLLEAPRCPIEINHNFIVVNETFGAQSFHAISSMEDFDDLQERYENDQFDQVEASTFNHIKRV